MSGVSVSGYVYSLEAFLMIRRILVIGLGQKRTEIVEAKERRSFSTFFTSMVKGQCQDVKKKKHALEGDIRNERESC